MTLHTTPSAPSQKALRSQRQEKYQNLFRKIHEQKAKTIFGMAGLMVMLPMAVKAQGAGLVSLDDVENVVSYELLADGTISATLSNGQTVVVSNTTVAADGSVMVSQLTAAELTAAAEVAFGTGGEIGLAGAAAAAGVGLLALAAGGGGGGNSRGGGGGGNGSISKSLQIIDAPLENALVFYDTNNNGTAQESEYLGLTDASGAINVTYTPVSGGSFIILASPGAEGEANFGWSSNFADQFDDVETRDVVTGNIFDITLELLDNGTATPQVASPLSTLIAVGGMTGAEVKEAFGIPEGVDLDTFNFYAALSSSDPAVKAAAEKASAAAVIATSVAQAAVTAASANSTTGVLTGADKQAVMAKAMADAAEVLKTLPGGTSPADAASAAAAVAVAGALNPDLDTTAIANSILSAVTGGGTVSSAIADTVAALQAEGALSASASNTVNSSSAALKISADNIATLFTNVSGPTSDEFAARLDDAVDAAAQSVQNAVNSELLGISLVKDVNTIAEGAVYYAKGNVLDNDSLSSGGALPSTTGIHSINGKVLSGVEGTEGSNYFAMSTADWNTFEGETTVTKDVIASAIGVRSASFPAAYGTNGAVTKGSAVTNTVTVEAGDTLTFNYTFMSYDYVPYSDYSFFGLKATSGGTAAEQAGLIQEVFGVDELKGTSWYNLAGTPITQSSTFTYTFTKAGTFDLSIGVMDALDTVVDSYFWVSDIAVNDTVVSTGWDQLGNTMQTEAIDSTVVSTVVTGYYGTLIITKGGSYIYQVGGVNAEPIPEGKVVTDDFTYTVQLDNGSLATQTLSIKVTGVDDTEPLAPTIQLSTADVIDLNDESYVIAGLTTNVAEGEEVIITISDGTETLTFTATVAADGTFSTTEDVSGLADVEDLEITASYNNGAAEVSTSVNVLKDTTADAGGDLTLTLGDHTLDTLTFEVSGLDEGSTATVTLTSGTTAVTKGVTANGTYTISTAAFAPGSELTVTYEASDAAGNATSGTVGTFTAPSVVNVTTGAAYTSLGDAITAASDDDTLVLAGGYTFDEDITIDKPLTIEGANAGIPAFTDAGTMDPEGGTGARFPETVIAGTVTVAASGVTIDGVKLDNFDMPLTWDESLLSTQEGALDDFSLLNTVMTTYAAAGSPTFNAGSDAPRGLYNGEAVADGWVISGNLIGGVVTSSGSNGGAMYLSGLSDATISDNMFWRPGAGHLYLASITGSEIDANYFYHGVHADGVDFDGYGDLFDNDGYGYGYGYGYGSGDAAEDFFGRNFWIEVKGTNSDLTISNNDGSYNSGGIQLYGEDAGYSFVNITITGNTFEDFINADPNGVLEGAAYYQSGFMGAIAVSIAEGSTAEGIVITDNVISAAVDQIFSDRDQTSLILVSGVVAGVTVSHNTLSWTTSSEAILNALSDLGVPETSYAGSFSGLLLAGGITGAALVSGNDFQVPDAYSLVSPAGIYVLGEVDGYGSFMAQIDETGNDFSDWTGVSVYLSRMSTEIDVGALSFEADGVYVGSDVDGDGADDIFYLLADMGTAGNDSFTGTSGSDIFFLGLGEDRADLRGGNDAVLLDNDLAGADSITGFSLGEADAGGDTLILVNLDATSLKGSGEYFQSVGSGAAVGDDTGLLFISNELPADAGNEQVALGSFLDTLNGLNEGDTFFVMADFDTTDAILTKVSVGAGGSYSAEKYAEFNGLSASDFGSASNFNLSNFAALPEV